MTRRAKTTPGTKGERLQAQFTKAKTAMPGAIPKSAMPRSTFGGGKWRLARVRPQAAGVHYWTLETGRRDAKTGRDTRRYLALGDMTDENAEVYLRGIEALRMIWNLHGAQMEAKYGAECAAVYASMEPHPDTFTSGHLGLIPPHWKADQRMHLPFAKPEWLVDALEASPNRDVTKAEILQFLLDLGRPETMHTVMVQRVTPSVTIVPEIPSGIGVPNVYTFMTMAQYHDEVWAPYRAAKRPKTWKREKGLWKNQLLPRWGETRMTEIDSGRFALWLDDLKVQKDYQGKAKEVRWIPASGSTKRLVRSALQAMLKSAKKHNHVRMTPNLGEYQIEGSTRARWSKDTLTAEERHKLIGAAGAPHKALFALGSVAGLRPGEVCRVRWEDVQWSRGVIRVRVSKTARHIARTEAQAEAELVMVPVRIFGSLAYLRDWWILCGQPIAGPVFPSGVHMPVNRKWVGFIYDPMAPSIESYDSALRSACRRAGIVKRVTQYTLRHTAATRALAAGRTVEEVARQLRDNPETIRKFYDCTTPVDTVSEDFGAWVDVPDPAPAAGELVHLNR